MGLKLIGVLVFFLAVVQFEAPVWAMALDHDPEIRAAEAQDLGVDFVEEVVQGFTNVLFIPNVIEKEFTSSPNRLVHDSVEGFKLNNDHTLFTKVSQKSIANIRNLVVSGTKDFEEADFNNFKIGYERAFAKGEMRANYPKLISEISLATSKEILVAWLDGYFLPMLDASYYIAWTYQQNYLKQEKNQQVVVSKALANALHYWPFAKYNPILNESSGYTHYNNANEAVESLRSFPTDWTFIKQRRGQALKIIRSTQDALKKLEEERCAKLLLVKKD